MKFTRFIFLPLLLLVASCASSGVKLNSQFCGSRSGVWGNSEEKLQYQVSKNISGFGIEERRIRDIFKQRSYDCRMVSKMRVTIKQGFFEALISLIPGYSSNTVIIDFNLEDS
ncbi:hypothetical protein M902_2690 [Bacteriovorax sp. BAL6_X]|uniref:hypothetical protein n=1 Tax=Bacteriovorax sp. BAL6_X TaxID=1201290 RepID=UPI000386BE90|nr:hypothetical protein [Bacteriovorax sp. BAL6_X]EPZ51456.1 hypothetical protein M902_2690 [Bacteriovorax sp. BAL6_X]